MQTIETRAEALPANFKTMAEDINANLDNGSGICMQTITLTGCFMQTIGLTVVYMQTIRFGQALCMQIFTVACCMCAKYATMGGCSVQTVQVLFSSLQGMDASGEPLLQFKFRVQFYVETHLLLRYVYSRLCCFHHLLSSTSMPYLALIAFPTATTTCTLLIVLHCYLHHFSHLFVLTPSPHCPRQQVVCSPHSTRLQVSSLLKRVPTTCCFVLRAL